MSENMQDNDSSYKLRCSLIGHSQDVRAVAVSTDGDIVTASRDQTAKLWKESQENCCNYEEKVNYMGHTSYVTSICLIPGDDVNAEGYTVTGSKDSTILVFPRMSFESAHCLSGHTDTVSCLTWENKTLISGSWDHTIRIWNDWECSATLKGHSGPVWSLAVIKPGEPEKEMSFISASADKTLKLWNGGKALVTYMGHTDCVRGVSVLDAEKFISCSNDASIRLWNISGNCLATYYGHSNFIYSVFCLEPSSGFISGGEDRTVKVWDALGNNVSTVYLPAQSVWSVAALPNSDIVVGTSDGVCRVFSRSIDRQTSADEMSVFEGSLAKFKVAVEDVGGIKKSDLPDKTVLFTPGKRDGQTIMVKDGDKVLCYNWSASKGEWEAVGEVIGGTGGSAASSGKVLFEGREYDYVFDVDLDEGRMLKLPYNKGEDPWVVSQAFIHKHELPQDNLDQVANFITTNAKVSSQSPASSNYYDPFTGGSRYVPSGSSVFNGASNSLNGGSSQAVRSPYFPQAVYLKFENVNKEGILAKFEEFNALVSDPLSKESVHRLVDAVLSPEITASDLAPLEKALQWPSHQIWPALDVLRLALRSEAAQSEWLKEGKGNVLVDLLNQLLQRSSSSPTQLLSLRCLVNMGSRQPGREVLARAINSVITSTVSLAPFANKNIEIAAATLFINYSIILKENKNMEDQCQLLSGIATVALTANDPEAQYRILVAMGTLMSGGCKSILSLSKSLDIKPIIEKFSLMEDPRKLGECGRHLLQFFK